MSARQRQRVVEPVRRSEPETSRGTRDSGGFGQRAQHDSYRTAHGGTHDSAQRKAFRDFVQQHGRGYGVSGRRKVARRHPHRDEAPAVQHRVNGGGDEQRTGKPVEGGGAAIVIVIMGAGRADRDVRNGRKPSVPGSRRQPAAVPGDGRFRGPVQETARRRRCRPAAPR